MAIKATTVAEVMAGEARSEQDWEMIASTIVNRAQLANTTLESIVQAPGQFDAYGKNLPAGVTKKDVARAQAVLDRVVKEGVPPQYSNAIGYARDYAVGNLPGSWTPTGIVTPDKHVVYSAPAGAYIATTAGYVRPRGVLPSPEEAAALANYDGPPVNTSNPFEPQPNAGPAGWAYRDLAPPNPVQTVATDASGVLPSPMGAGLLDNVTYSNQNAQRNQPLNEDFEQRISRAVHSYFGPDYKADIVSGKGVLHDQKGNPLGVGNANHPYGIAADFDVVNTKTGQKVDSATMADFAAYAAVDQGITGIGGPSAGYMGAGRVHFDTRHPRLATWGMPAAYAQDIRDSVAAGAALPGPGAPVPTARPDPELAPDANVAYAAPVGPVERGVLPDVPATGPMPRMGDLVSLPGMESFTAPDARRGVQLASLAPMGGSFTDYPDIAENEAQTQAAEQKAGMFQPSAPQRQPSLAERMGIFSPDTAGSLASGLGIAPAQAATSPDYTFDPSSIPDKGLLANPPPKGIAMSMPAQHTFAPDLSRLGMEAFTPPSNEGILRDVVAPQSLETGLARQTATGLLSPQLRDTGLLGMPASLAQQETALAAMQPGLTPRQTVQPPQQPAPALPAPKTIQDAPTIAPAPTATAGTFPAAPEEPEDDGIFGPRMKAATAGLLMGGPVGALAGYMMGDKFKDIGGVLGRLDNGPMGPVAASDRFNAGYGIRGVEQGMYGPRGATGYSRSNPNSFTVSRGPGQGFDLHNQFGAVTPYSADGHVMANADTMNAWGRVLGGLFDGVDTGGFSDRERAEWSGRAGPW